jgi:hypothetical protein
MVDGPGESPARLLPLGVGGVAGVSRGRSTSLGVCWGWEGPNVRWRGDVV